jgi:hypothetical protein
MGHFARRSVRVRSTTPATTCAKFCVIAHRNAPRWHQSAPQPKPKDTAHSHRSPPTSPRTGRHHLGIMGDDRSERWATIHRNGWATSPEPIGGFPRKQHFQPSVNNALPNVPQGPTPFTQAERELDSLDRQLKYTRWSSPAGPFQCFKRSDPSPGITARLCHSPVFLQKVSLPMTSRAVAFLWRRGLIRRGTEHF